MAVPAAAMAQAPVAVMDLVPVLVTVLVRAVDMAQGLVPVMDQVLVLGMVPAAVMARL